jgi:hypothetical protein
MTGRIRHLLIGLAAAAITAAAVAVGVGGWMEDDHFLGSHTMQGGEYTVTAVVGHSGIDTLTDGNWTIRGGSLQPMTPGCSGDIDGNGEVDITDLLALLADFGTPAGDIDGDGIGDINDLLILLSQFGSACDGA